MPSTMVYSGVFLVPSALVSSSIVHSVAIAIPCSSCTNSLNSRASSAPPWAVAKPSKSDLPPQQIPQTLAAVLTQRAEAADVADLIGDFRGIKKRHAAQVLHNAGVILGEQGGIQCPAAVGSMVEADLVGQRGLAGARIPLDDVEPTFEKAATQDGVEPGNAGRHAAVGVGFAHCGGPPMWRGKVTVNRAPPPGASSTAMLPSMA